MLPTSTAHPVPADLPARRHLSYQELDILHALRGFCAFYVVIYHAKFILWSGGRAYLEAFPRSTWGIGQYVAFLLDLLSSAGYEMVIFFFVLSGFFIRYAQLKRHRPAGAFYLNRIVRIYPPYLVSLLLAALVLVLLATQVPQVLNPNLDRELNTVLTQAWAELRSFDFWAALRTLVFVRVGELYVGNNVVYWSLLPEAIFYLLIPLVFRNVRWYLLASVGLYLLGAWLHHSGAGQSEIVHAVLDYNLFFALGTVLYDVVTGSNLIERVRRLPRWLTLAVLGGLLLAIIGLALLKLKALAALVAGIMAVLSVLVLLAGHVSRQNPLVRVLHRLGIFSFSLYLYHYPLLLLGYGLLVQLTGQLVIYQRVYWLAVPIVTLLCYGLYWVTERVFINYFRKV